MKKFKIPESSRRFLSQSEIARLIRTAADPQLYADREPCLFPFIATAVYAGLRKSELFALEWPDIDFARNTLTVRNKTSFTTKSKKNRVIELHPKLKRILKTYEQKSGRCFDVTNWRRVFNRIARQAKIPDLKLHELRHTFITHALITDKVDIPTVSAWAGHSSWATTKIYTHLLPASHKNSPKLKF